MNDLIRFDPFTDTFPTFSTFPDVFRGLARPLRTERQYGRVQRSFSLGQDIDSAGIKAKYDQGVLNLVLPKKAGVASRQISVQ